MNDKRVIINIFTKHGIMHHPSNSTYEESIRYCIKSWDYPNFDCPHNNFNWRKTYLGAEIDLRVEKIMRDHCE